MAQLNLTNIKRIEKYRNTVHEKAFSTYTVFNKGEDKYFQIDTYGKVDRKIPEKVSQSLQFDREAARFLVDALTREFNL